MKKILLVCSAGMSTSLLVSKMQQAAKDKNIECSISATGESELKENMDGTNVIFLLSKIKKLVEPNGIEVDVINSVNYGTMNGELVLKQALDLIK